MNIYRSIKKVPKEANLLFGCALAGLLLKFLLLTQMPIHLEWVRSLMELFQDVMVSIVASYIFFFFVVHIKEHADKKVVSPYIEKHTKRVVGECISQLSDIAQGSGINLKLDDLNQERVTSAFLKINPTSNAPLMFFPPNGYANWLQYFQFHNSRSKESINRVLAQFTFLEAKHVSLLVSIDDCLHFQMMNHMQNHQITNADMSAFASTFFEYCQLCRKLDSYVKHSLEF